MSRGRIRTLWLAGATLMMLDGVTTYLALSAVTGAREGNPVGVWAISHMGLAYMCIAKILIGILMVYRLTLVADRGHRFTWLSRNLLFKRVSKEKAQRGAYRSLIFTVVLMSLVVLNNSVIIVMETV